MAEKFSVRRLERALITLVASLVIVVPQMRSEKGWECSSVERGSHGRKVGPRTDIYSVYQF